MFLKKFIQNESTHEEVQCKIFYLSGQTGGPRYFWLPGYFATRSSATRCSATGRSAVETMTQLWDFFL